MRTSIVQYFFLTVILLSLSRFQQLISYVYMIADDMADAGCMVGATVLRQDTSATAHSSTQLSTERIDLDSTAIQ